MPKVLKDVCSEEDSLLLSVVSAQKSLSTEKCTPQTSAEGNTTLFTFDEYLEVSDSEADFLLHLEYFPPRVEDKEMATRGQSSNPLWFAMRKHVISASKAHEVKTRMISFLKKGNSLQSLCEKLSGKANMNPDIPALQYGRAMEPTAVSHF